MRMGPVDKATGKATVLEAGKPRETRIFGGKVYGMEEAIKGDVAILRAWKVDEAGNCQFRYVGSIRLEIEVCELNHLDIPPKHSAKSWARQQQSPSSKRKT